MYIPLDELRQAPPELAYPVWARERVQAILHHFDTLFKKLSIEWKSENEVTLVRMGKYMLCIEMPVLIRITGHQAPPTVRELVDVEKVYPGTGLTPNTPPWGFVDLTKNIGSTD